MVALSDETRFKNLPPKEEWDKFLEVVKENNGRILYIEETFWHNALTRCKGRVLDIPIFAHCDDGDRTAAVTDIIKEEIDVLVDDDGDKHYSVVSSDKWVFNRDYAHINITTSIYEYVYKKYTADEKHFTKYTIYGHQVCCPITRHHMYDRDLEELTLLFKGQLMGQNNGSPFRTVDSVANNYYDRCLKDGRGSFIKRTAPAVQLLTKFTMQQMTEDIDALKTKIEGMDLPVDDSQVMVKLLNNTYYSRIKTADLEKYEQEGRISAYYPVITFENTQNILENLPKIEVPMGVMGLGSASTGILDQIVRGTFFNKYLLCDFDTIEEKNLRNQWYVRNQVGQTKTQASRTTIGTIKNLSSTEVILKNCKFQEAHLEAYDFKYLISGFDSIECRLELLDYVQTGKTKAKYIIDTRYDDLSSSIFFVDTNNPDEMEYYKQGLLSDKEAFDKIREEKSLQSWEQFQEWLEKHNVFTSGCATFCSDIDKLLEQDFVACPCEDSTIECRSQECLGFFKRMWEDHKDVIKRACYTEAESSCLRQNFIDIYKFTSSFVFAAVRAIESDEGKPFTHIDATTEGIPRSMIIRK